MNPREELFQLLNLQVEERLADKQHVRLNELLRSNPELVDDYVDYSTIHAQLHWDAGLSLTISPVATANASQPARRTPSSNRRLFATAAAAAAIVVCTVIVSRMQNPPQLPNNNTADNSANQPEVQDAVSVASNETGATEGDRVAPLEMRNTLPKENSEEPVSVATNEPSPKEYLPAKFTDDDVISGMNDFLATTWSDQSVQPSPVASDFEWLRRVYLTFAGRIPTLQESEAFLADTSLRKYDQLVRQMSTDTERASYLAVVWTNLLIGRTEKRGVNREKLFEYLVEMFQENRPWMQTVDELISASGRNDQNGATNFLLAHLNNEATPATAVTARLFLGEQISCVQCHDHPFTKGYQQEEYWALNAFFKDTQQKSVPIAAGSDTSVRKLAWTLSDKPHDRDRMTYFSTRSGMQKAVLPAYDGITMKEDSQENRRETLARLLASDSSRRVARSMVNRMWSHFFGYGFTPSVDDMGAHATVSHPELLEMLTEAFVKSDYDVQRLMVWIGSSQAWRLSSDLTEANEVDQPDRGEVPLFSRVYVRRMSPEQVYESIRVAIRSAAGQPIPDAAEYSQHRRDWIGQFTRSYDTDENDESMEFNGTIAQAMVMMNGDEVADAIRKATQSILEDSPGRRAAGRTLDRVALAMLTRESTDAEESVFKNRYRQLAQQDGINSALPVAVEDMMWAYLNSSEFQLIH